MKYLKGKETKKSILENARQIFNQKGISLTLDALVREMGITKSRLTNHYPTKEALFRAILNSYEYHFANSIIKFHSRPPSLQLIADTMNEVMDIQFEFRTAIVYAVVATPFERGHTEQVNSTFQRNTNTLKKRLVLLADKGLLKKDILEPEHFDAFIFQYTTLLTTWVIPLQMYNSELGFPSLKPTYIKATMNCYLPYLTSKGQREFDTIRFEQYNKIVWEINESESTDLKN